MPEGLFQRRFVVPVSAIDANGHANNLEYLRWTQELATGHSDARGWTLDRYRREGTTWVVRAHQVEYLRPAFADETLLGLTWIGGFDGAASPRHTLFWRPADRRLIARVRTDWVHVSAATGRAQEVSAAFRDDFPSGLEEAVVVRLLKQAGPEPDGPEAQGAV